MRPVAPRSEFGEPRVLFEHGDPAIVAAWVRRAWPAGLPATVDIGPWTAEQFVRRWHANL
jgi:hypothetical protein